MQDPGTRIICPEPEGNVVARATDGNYIANHRVDIVVRCITCASDNVEVLLCIIVSLPVTLRINKAYTV